MELKSEITIFEHQQKFVELSRKHHYLLLGDTMGLGKTLSAIAVSLDMNAERTLVVCPAFLRHNWRMEIEKFVEGNEGKFEVISYAQLRKAERTLNGVQHIIFDEAHYLMNMGAQRTMLAHGLVQGVRPQRLSLLTGTPIKNKVKEFYSLLRLLSYCPTKANGIDIRKEFMTATRFAQAHSHDCSYEIERGGRRIKIEKYKGYKNLEQLRSYFHLKYLGRKTEQVIKLPELLERYVECNYKFDDKELKNYEKFQGKIEGHIMAIKRGSAMAKANFTADYAKNINEQTGRPVVIFSDHVDPVNYIASKLKRAAAITGSTSMDRRHTIVQMFQQGKLDYLVATIGAASTGITLTKASDLVFNDMSYVPADNAQASKRIHRIGQENTCRIHKICGSYIDRMIMTSLTSKQDVINKVL